MVTFLYLNQLEEKNWYYPGRGPRYAQLSHFIRLAIQEDKLSHNDQLPPERELAEMMSVSRVTVRKAIAELAEEGLVKQRRGSGSFIYKKQPSPKLEQSLASLVSFTENMANRGLTATSQVIESGMFTPNPQETVTLGTSSNQMISRISRLRMVDQTPIAIEISSLPADILPNPEDVTQSLYRILRAKKSAPVRAIQRVSAINLGAKDAATLALPTNSAALKIERTGYLASGRPIEFTSGVYRSDMYDFVTELRRE